MESHITIDRAYYEVLVRRAQFNSEAFNRNHGQGVTLPQAEYDNLNLIARQYENLKRNLMRGGVVEETIDLLSQDDATIQDGLVPETSQHQREATHKSATDVGTAPTQTSPPGLDKPRTFRPRPQHDERHNSYSGYSGHNEGYHYGGRGAWAEVDEVEPDDEDSFCDEVYSPDGPSVPEGVSEVKPQMKKQQFNRQCTRTVQLYNLSESTTHADITNAVRGGMLLDVFLRAHDRYATVSFLHAADARKFFEHVRKNDLYIKNKRVDIKWCDRQFVLPGHIAGKIAQGATRNLVIRRCGPKVSEEGIREDLDHIHNLAVIKIELTGGNCYISLNAVHMAVYAKTCMMSRLKYKTFRIDWDVDECAQPYDPLPAPKQPKEVNLPKPAAPANRFQLLNLDDDGEDEIAAAFQSKKRVGIAV
ncbi:hypothetical protein NEUTE1DRAFT_129390 [Neurospora tetrasperma FGSC 2508]|uniref:RRM domain-containing protein n=1 Tax=Neurospora tetrasperma (strain FGSC 2508 / ATCC MYA-4615 / P0657) TaxID=510951 RepID=F8MKL3_NEUT8|nr:uncharacterized protein NEUTE1DRAFT_129390 [Neurospora tetrasperma FGSC 2508]EGO57443.1 hypothetical protein NEUTE1DRAFT_129390 [Neurospora tetrasperma FGSC 2508]EGZ72299.1 hypothetical protein NEUTE2DRAFT_90424 [Neurospora tetrasperma FGSC 2509]